MMIKHQRYHEKNRKKISERPKLCYKDDKERLKNELTSMQGVI